MVTPSVTARGFYMNFRDGSERWEDFVTGPFIDHLQETVVNLGVRFFKFIEEQNSKRLPADPAC